MDVVTDDGAGGRAAREPASLRAFRVGLAVMSGLVLWQATMAGQSLSGNDAAVSWHAAGSNALFAVSLATAVAATVAWRRGVLTRGAAAVGAIGVPLLVALQAWAGYARWLHLHVPLGVTLLGVALGSLLFASRDRAPAPGR